MTTFNDWVEKSWRRVYSGAIDSTVQLTAALDNTTTTFNVTPANSVAMRAGAIISVDLEVMYVTGWSNGSVTVARGYEGSTAAAHDAGTLIYIQPKYTKFDIAVTLNDELNRLSSPDNGLFRVGMQTITYNPVYMGYDLTQAKADNFIDIMEVRHKIPFPTRNYPKIAKWKVLRSIGDSAFPSGMGIVFYEGGYPGQPIYVQYSAAFVPLDLTALGSDNKPTCLGTDITTTGMTTTMADIPPLGVEIQLTLPREIKRNFMESQPDPRKAPEVPSLAVSNSVQALMMTYEQRISEEAARLQRQYTRTEGW